MPNKPKKSKKLTASPQTKRLVLPNDEPVKINMPFEEAVKKALNTPIKKKMEIISTICHLSKFNMSNDKWKNPINGRQGQKFKLLPAHPEHKHVFMVDLNVYVTNLDTDFILDMDINSIIGFDVETKVPTVEDLYEVYLHVNSRSNGEIIKRAMKEGIDVDVTCPPAPLSTLTDSFNVAIGNSLTFESN
jgi:hypothetical protein